MGLFGKHRDVGSLIDLLRGDEEDKAQVRNDAYEELKKIGKPAVMLLIAALGDSDRHLRQSAAFALGDIGDRRAIGPLQRAQRTDTNPGVVYMAKSVLDDFAAK